LAHNVEISSLSFRNYLGRKISFRNSLEDVVKVGKIGIEKKRCFDF
jgi:hypothetical protein